MSPPAHEIVVVPPKDETRRQECYNVRIQVFVHEQGFPLDVEIDEFDGTSTHFLLRLVPSLIPIGTIRACSPIGASYYKLSRLAVLKEYRQFKFGRDLVLALHDWVKAETKRIGGLDHAEVIAHSQIPVKSFYAKYGYEPEGGEFDEDGAPHQKMVVRLPLGP
ncbi:hypothetical protein PILCRDRAFT_168664 [Piloderma croceum F 1598]|uniref:N-acetyltransferase domain-containing protein n=1 Tax=Piloderma croceum (strain F 1598) TaxID=765440 RepID=A0A0C3GKS7_PILCF|nr:hypothetical protein PILCRDRAFT_168664 [Piloderma croceum F 1598]